MYNYVELGRFINKQLPRQKYPLKEVNDLGMPSGKENLYWRRPQSHDEQKFITFFLNELAANHDRLFSAIEEDHLGKLYHNWQSFGAPRCLSFYTIITGDRITILVALSGNFSKKQARESAILRELNLCVQHCNTKQNSQKTPCEYIMLQPNGNSSTTMEINRLLETTGDKQKVPETQNWSQPCTEKIVMRAIIKMVLDGKIKPNGSQGAVSLVLAENFRFAPVRTGNTARHLVSPTKGVPIRNKPSNSQFCYLGASGFALETIPPCRNCKVNLGSWKRILYIIIQMDPTILKNIFSPMKKSVMKKLPLRMKLGSSPRSLTDTFRSEAGAGAEAEPETERRFPSQRGDSISPSNLSVDSDSVSDSGFSSAESTRSIPRFSAVTPPLYEDSSRRRSPSKHLSKDSGRGSSVGSASEPRSRPCSTSSNDSDTGCVTLPPPNSHMIVTPEIMIPRPVRMQKRTRKAGPDDVSTRKRANYSNAADSQPENYTLAHDSTHPTISEKPKLMVPRAVRGRKHKGVSL